MHFEIDVGRVELLMSAQLADFLPDFIQTVGHSVNVELLFVHAALDFIARLDKEVYLLLRDALIPRLHVLLLCKLLRHIPHTLHIEWNHSQGDARLIVLELLF